MPLETELQVASHVYVGVFHLSQHLIQGSFTHFHPLTGDEQPSDQRIKLHAGLYFHCEDLFNPQVGDIRIQFSYAGLADPRLPSLVLTNFLHDGLLLFGISSGNQDFVYR